MKFGVVVFPGSNCDRDMIEAIRDVLGMDVIELWHKDNDLGSFTTDDCIVLPGGFSYGDYLRCGAIARFSPMMQEVIRFAADGGKVLGVCNGFQILCESGLLPGALLKNAGQHFICQNVHVVSPGEPGRPLQIPIAHGEGRYHADEDTLSALVRKGQILYQYCDAEGQISELSNPNGSAHHIAGIRNERGNVFGMMPHPERACDPRLGNTDGVRVFEQLFHLTHAF